jgi:subtilisin family serine protease
VQNEVNIISISAGFKHHSSDLEGAVKMAKEAGIIVFAAASNWGNKGEVAFPARHRDYAVCIFSTTTNFKSSDFNPVARTKNENFAILGEDIEVHPNKERKKGTSMATAIAAGLAARILDFTRHTDSRRKGVIQRVADVGTKVGMTAIFAAMSRPHDNYDCVALLRLMNVRYDLNSRQENRIYVQGTISRAMENAY